jgi:biofilm PGA synthesis N-glycosyltransferase PgaC
MSNLPSFVIVTPARNESRFIELTIQSVIAQSVRPVKWVIVSDGSTDGTDDIVRGYMERYSWIELVRMPERKERHFAGKVTAFNAGYARLRDISYDVIVSLDGDVSFDAEYFAFLLRKLADDAALGLIGTPFRDGDKEIYDYRFVNIEHVSGACQVFRRECFEAIGGYTPIKGGGIDYLAVLSSRMKGWKTRTFTEKICVHHREMGTAQHSVLRSRYNYGVKDYAFGNHPLWEISRTVYQMTKRPFFVGGLALLSGYLAAAVRHDERPISPEMKCFVQQEQLQRLKNFVLRKSPATADLRPPAKWA